MKKNASIHSLPNIGQFQLYVLWLIVVGLLPLPNHFIMAEVVIDDSRFAIGTVQIRFVIAKQKSLLSYCQMLCSGFSS